MRQYQPKRIPDLPIWKASSVGTSSGLFAYRRSPLVTLVTCPRQPGDGELEASLSRQSLTIKERVFIETSLHGVVATHRELNNPFAEAV